MKGEGNNASNTDSRAVENQYLNTNGKMKMYKTAVRLVTTYAAETRVTAQNISRLPNTFQLIYSDVSTYR